MTTPARPFAAIGRPLIATLVLVALVVQAPHHAAAQTHSAFADSGTLVYADARTAGDIDPASDSEASNDIVARNTAQTLVAFDGASITRYKPALATRWTVGVSSPTWPSWVMPGRVTRSTSSLRGRGSCKRASRTASRSMSITSRSSANGRCKPAGESVAARATFANHSRPLM